MPPGGAVKMKPPPPKKKTISSGTWFKLKAKTTSKQNFLVTVCVRFIGSYHTDVCSSALSIDQFVFKELFDAVLMIDS